ncbi:unnamed protein product, partial [Symbiodinium necroappetens]
LRDPMLERLAKCSRASDEANVCRNLHRLLKHPDFTLQVQIDNATVDITHPRSRKHTVVPWPVIKLSSWLRYIVEEQGGQLLLGGHHVSQTGLWKQMLREFWARYRGIDPNHPIYHSNIDPATAIPFMVHGDDGRGRNHQPVLVISFQALLSHMGPGRLNQSGHSFCSRLLFSILPSLCYRGDSTIFQLLSCLADDCISLFQDGLVTNGATTERIHMAWLGCKGDWVWLRKAFCLETGFSSRRVCHMCDQQAGYPYSLTFLIFFSKYIYIYTRNSL